MKSRDLFVRIVSLFALLLIGFAQARAAEDQPKAPTGQKLDLKLNLKQGAKQNLVMTADQKIGIEMGGAKQNMNNFMSFGWTQEVQAVDEKGNATVKMTYTTVKFKMEAGAMAMEYDSEKGQAPPAMLAWLGAISGAGFTFKVSPAGKVLEVTGADEMLQKMAEKMPAAQRDQMTQQLKGQFGAKMVENMYDYYPDHAIDNGDTWERTQKMPEPLNADAKTKYTLLDHGGGKASIKIDGTIEAQGAGPKLTGKQTGSMVVDEATGLPSKADIQQDLKGEVQNMPMTIIGTITIESK